MIIHLMLFILDIGRAFFFVLKGLGTSDLMDDIVISMK